MYQAYVVQEFKGDPCNIILGDKYTTIDDAYNAICTYESCFGKCKSATIEPAGREIQTAPAKKFRC